MTVALCAFHNFTQVAITEFYVSLIRISLMIYYKKIKKNSEYKTHFSWHFCQHTLHSNVFYTTRFVICSHIPPLGDKANELGSNTMGIGVFLLTLIWYFDRRETNPTLVCISPNRIPVKIIKFVFRMSTFSFVIMSIILQLESQGRTHLSFFMQTWDYGELNKK